FHDLYSESGGAVACLDARGKISVLLVAMSRRKKSAITVPKSALVRRRSLPSAAQRFGEVLKLIEAARGRAYQAVNTELVTLYWQLGEYISKKLETAEWGDAVVDELANTIAREYPGIRGYTVETCSACGSSTRPIGAPRKCHRW